MSPQEVTLEIKSFAATALVSVQASVRREWIGWRDYWLARPDLVRRVERGLMAAGVAAAMVYAVAYEVHTATLQSRVMGYLAGHLTWQMAPGESPNVVFPRYGPFDEMHGYTRIPEFRRRLEGRGYRIARQARFSRPLAAVAALGVSPPSRERPLSGLVIRSRDGRVLFDATARRHQFERIEEVPPPVVSALFLMEDRSLGRGGPFGNANPAVDWGRLARAAVFSAGNRLGLPVSFQGGSTIAVQMEKYRHSKNGRTETAGDKLQQILSATLRAYREGPGTGEEQHRIVLDYLNTVPLGAAPRYGEVHGLGEGLRAWFAMDPAHTFRQLAGRGHGRARARAYKHVLALLCAVRAPTRMLLDDRPELERRVSFYLQRMIEHGLIDPALARRVDETPLRFAKQPLLPPMTDEQRRIVNRVRFELPQLLGLKDLYELDRLDLEVETTYDGALESRALGLIHSLGDPDSVAALGLHAPRLLEQGDPSRVWYSLLLCERGPDGDMVSVVADNLDRPFDPTTGMRMQLGSTAKLRTMAHHLEVIERLHRQLGGIQSADSLKVAADAARDPLTRWAALELAGKPGMPLDSLIARALDRKYSAAPWEAFFTGGGLHTFHNFDEEDDRRRPTLRDAFTRSTNLVFIRLMRDLVRYHEARLPYDAHAVLADSASPVRTRLLQDAAREESQLVLRRAHKKLAAAGDSLPERVLGRPATERELAMFFFAWHHAAPADSLAAWLARRGHVADSATVARLHQAYGGDHLKLRDYAYLLGRHPLAIWCAGELEREPGIAWKELLARSEPARQESEVWLFEPRNRRAQQVRLRTRIEHDAFVSMTRDWRRLGFPFERLVPSYATAIGSSADRPNALAELMGAIVNDGVRREATTIRRIRFGPGTPYETVLEPTPREGERILSAPVARTLRGLLAGVVEHGTARRLAGAFGDSSGVVMGGKTGSGDNRHMTYGRGGRLIGSHAVNRTATFVFYIGDRYYGVAIAAVDGRASGGYGFTSALPVQLVRLLAPALEERMKPGSATD